MKTQARSYFYEAKWFDGKYTPAFDEYMDVASVSSGCWLLTVTSWLYMGDIVTDEALEWASKFPKIVRALSNLTRLVDDLATHKVEQERGDVASSIECYMKQHGASEQEACEEVQKQIVDAWKDINEEWLDEAEYVPRPLLVRVINLARSMDVFYKDGDNYSNSGGAMRTFIQSLFVDAFHM